MARIKLLRDCHVYSMARKKGTVVEVEEPEARSLCEAKYATPVADSGGMETGQATAAPEARKGGKK